MPTLSLSLPLLRRLLQGGLTLTLTCSREGAVHIALEYMDASLLDILRCEAPAGVPD